MFKLMIFPAVALLGELHQSLKGYPFNIYQIFDGGLHHEHFILFFGLLSIIAWWRKKNEV